MKERGAGRGGDREVKGGGGGKGVRQEGREGGRECTKSTEEWEGQSAGEREERGR